MEFTEFFDWGGFILREATDDDVPVLVALINHAFAYQDAAKGDVRIDDVGVRHKMESSTFYVVHDVRGQPAACLYLRTLTATLYFGLLSVADDYRGTGLAPAMMGAIELYARATGLRKLRLDYMSLSPWLETYYARFGFTRSGVVRDIGWAQLIRMEKALT